MVVSRVLDLLRGPPRPRIVVSGMPKSGTTAVAMLLGAAAGLEVNSDPFHRLDRAGIAFRDALYRGNLTLSALVRRHARFFRGGLVKDPNFIYLPDVFDTFPGAGFVFVVRDPRDNIRSLLNRLKLPGRVSEAPAGFGDVNDTWQRALEGRTPDVPGADYVERLAHRWVLAARNCVSNEGRMRVIRYETFTADKTAAVETALAGVGVAGGRSIEAIADRQFQPRGQRNVTPMEFFGESELRAVERICADEMARFGYAPLLTVT